MTENADDEAVAYVDTVTARAQAGAKGSGSADSLKPIKLINSFTFKDTTEVEDGSTVIIAYYTRNKYTITFKGTWTSARKNMSICTWFPGYWGLL